MIWSLCASVDEEGRQKIDNFMRELEGSNFPLRDTIYEYYVDARQRIFVSWEEKLSSSWKFATGYIPTLPVSLNYIHSQLDLCII
jgi:dynein heavy chain